MIEIETDVAWDTAGVCNLRYEIDRVVTLATKNYGNSATLEFSNRKEASLFIKFLVPELVEAGYLPVVNFFSTIPTAEIYW